MTIAAALLAGGAVFFAGFCLGCFPPVRPSALKRRSSFSAQQNKLLENFLNYNGEIMP
ncbi:MAG: hypothetical protein J5659_05695 [Clostridia bacterium]|nr:hypothetical protein [Clostridia bacterium]